jgi:hypothetical protein
MRENILEKIFENLKISFVYVSSSFCIREVNLAFSIYFLKTQKIHCSSLSFFSIVRLLFFISNMLLVFFFSISHFCICLFEEWGIFQRI